MLSALKNLEQNANSPDGATAGTDPVTARTEALATATQPVAGTPTEPQISPHVSIHDVGDVPPVAGPEAATEVFHADVCGDADLALNQLQLWRSIRDLAGKSPEEVRRIANGEIQRLEAEVLDLWEVLVPVACNDGVPFSEAHHEAFRRVIRDLPGNSGTTTRPAGDGDWQDGDTGKVFVEKMIPIRFRACKADAQRIAEHARKFYNQIAVMAYKIASGRDIIMATIED